MKLKMILNFNMRPDVSFREKSPARMDREHRCQCGNLLARLGPNGVELKCRRCKRIVIIPWETSSTWQPAAVQSSEAE